jgi:hypothetical protein
VKKAKLPASSEFLGRIVSLVLDRRLPTLSRHRVPQKTSANSNFVSFYFLSFLLCLLADLLRSHVANRRILALSNVCYTGDNVNVCDYLHIKQEGTTAKDRG